MTEHRSDNGTEPSREQTPVFPDFENRTPEGDNDLCAKYGFSLVHKSVMERINEMIADLHKHAIYLKNIKKCWNDQIRANRLICRINEAEDKVAKIAKRQQPVFKQEPPFAPRVKQENGEIVDFSTDDD